jgi:hypothetical protein
LLLTKKFEASISNPSNNLVIKLKNFIESDGAKFLETSTVFIDQTDYVVDYPVLFYADCLDLE